MADWLEFDTARMRSAFNTHAFGFEHRLNESSLFQLPRLASLAEFLFREGGRRDVYNAAAAKRLGDAFGVNGERNWAPGRAIEEIETSGSWVVLKRVERDPEFRELINTCLDQIGRAVPELEPQRIKKAEGFVFVTSPHGITPYHMDPQWSFLAQIRGRKTYRIHDVLDPAVISAAEIENYYAGATMAAQYDTSKDAKATVFDLAPGMCANQPLHAPHSAVVHDEYSISLSIAVVTQDWAKLVPVHLANRCLRKVGLEPAPVGDNRLLDSVKSFTYRATARAGRELLELPRALKKVGRSA